MSHLQILSKMIRKNILKFTISSFILLFVLNVSAQTTSEQEQADETLRYPQRYGLRLGTDLYRLTRNIYDKDYQGFEFNGDYRLSQKWYAAAEIGNEKRTKDEADLYNYTTNGSYIKIGVDFNAHQNWMDREDMIYTGLRYGFSTFSQTLNSYKIYTTDPYFGEEIIEANAKYSGLSAHWLELVAGIKTRVFNNFFVGFNFQLKGLIAQKQPSDFENLFIPGYNRKYSGGVGVGFSYSVSYLIPLYKTNKGAFVIPEADPNSEVLEFETLDRDTK